MVWATLTTFFKGLEKIIIYTNYSKKGGIVPVIPTTHYPVKRYGKTISAQNVSIWAEIKIGDKYYGK